MSTISIGDAEETIIVTRQDLYDLLLFLSEESRWQENAGEWYPNENEQDMAQCIVTGMPSNFLQAVETHQKECPDGTIVVSDEELYNIFNGRSEDNYGWSCWIREFIPEKILRKFPFVYKETRHTLILFINDIEECTPNISFHDLCIAFMALYQVYLSDDEKRNCFILVKNLKNFRDKNG